MFAKALLPRAAWGLALSIVFFLAGGSAPVQAAGFTSSLAFGYAPMVFSLDDIVDSYGNERFQAGAGSVDLGVHSRGRTLRFTVGAQASLQSEASTQSFELRGSTRYYEGTIGFSPSLGSTDFKIFLEVGGGVADYTWEYLDVFGYSEEYNRTVPHVKLGVGFGFAVGAVAELDIGAIGRVPVEQPFEVTSAQAVEELSPLDSFSFTEVTFQMRLILFTGG